jgi:hypothetical protein
VSKSMTATFRIQNMDLGANTLVLVAEPDEGDGFQVQTSPILVTVEDASTYNIDEKVGLSL